MPRQSGFCEVSISVQKSRWQRQWSSSQACEKLLCCPKFEPLLNVDLRQVFIRVERTVSCRQCCLRRPGPSIDLPTDRDDAFLKFAGLFTVEKRPKIKIRIEPAVEHSKAKKLASFWPTHGRPLNRNMFLERHPSFLFLLSFVGLLATSRVRSWFRLVNKSERTREVNNWSASVAWSPQVHDYACCLTSR